MNPYKRDAVGRPGVPISIVANLVARRTDSTVNPLQVGISLVLVGSRRRYSTTLMPVVDGRPEGSLVYDVGVQQFVDAYRAYLLLTEFLRRSSLPLGPCELRDYIRGSHLAVTGDTIGDGDARTAGAMQRFRLLIAAGDYRQIRAVERSDISPGLLAIVHQAGLR